MAQMNFRENEYKELGLAARWLDLEHARHAYRFALQFSNKKRYGLDESTVDDIERHLIESPSVSHAWLKARVAAEGSVQIVYGEDQVCVIETKDFLDQWQNIFLPARDDAIVLHNLNRMVIFYCHEEELEVGLRNV